MTIATNTTNTVVLPPVKTTATRSAIRPSNLSYVHATNAFARELRFANHKAKQAKRMVGMSFDPLVAVYEHPKAGPFAE